MMRRLEGRTLLALVLGAGVLAGCGEGGLAGGLRSAGFGAAPDEFTVLPTKPLEVPENLGALPPPTPGAPNRVDPTPEADAIAALTGRPAPAGTAGAGSLVARAGPVDPAIRPRLAAEDTQYRRDNRAGLFDRLGDRDNPDAFIYQNMTLDANAEFDRLRALGVRVPAAPPLTQ